jgi:predicted metal-dependent enzyme (double-stranded beta helix superfamily)
MSYTLEQLSADIRQVLKSDSGTSGKQAVCKLVSKALLDQEFIAKHLTAEQCRPRKILYEDPELGFCVCGHVYADASTGKPHDHGSSWAIYGVAIGDTEMVDWRIVERGEGEQPILVEPDKTYVMRPGDSHLYDVGAVHSPNRRGLTKLVRIEGKNLDNVKRSNIKAAEHQPAAE